MKLTAHHTEAYTLTPNIPSLNTQGQHYLFTPKFLSSALLCNYGTILNLLFYYNFIIETTFQYMLEPVSFILFPGSFAELRKATVSFFKFVRPFVPLLV